jgi:hypothetical protein
MASQTIDKLDAACRQLNTAISLWFNNGDAVSIPTLTCSAYQIVHDVNRRSSETELLYDSIIVKDEYRREWVNNLKQGITFLNTRTTTPGKCRIRPGYYRILHHIHVFRTRAFRS